MKKTMLKPMPIRMVKKPCEKLHDVSYEQAKANGKFWCVSTSTSLMSLNWDEHFFLTHDEARAYRDTMENLGLAVLVVDQDGY